MKAKIAGFVAFLLVISMVAVPAFAASSGYSFNIYYRVDGKDQGEYHSLDKGSVTLDGYAYYNGTHYEGASVIDKGETVTYELWKDDSWADSFYGSITHYVSDTADMYHVDNIEDEFPEDADVSSSNYYLEISKSDNGWKMLGSGDLVQ